MRTSIWTSSSRNHSFTSIFMHNTSTQVHSLRELKTFTSTEDQELSSRVSEYLIGQPPRSNTAGRSMSTQEKHGTKPTKTWTLNGHPCNSSEKDWNPTLFNGSDLNSGERAVVQDCSLMKSQSPDGWDMVVILMILIRLFTLSLKLNKTNNCSSTLIQLLQRAENNSEKSGKKWHRWFLNSLIKTKLLILMRFPSQFHKNLTSKEYGDTIDTKFLRVLWTNLYLQVRSVNKTWNKSQNS